MVTRVTRNQSVQAGTTRKFWEIAVAPASARMPTQMTSNSSQVPTRRTVPATTFGDVSGFEKTPESTIMPGMWNR